MFKSLNNLLVCDNIEDVCILECIKVFHSLYRMTQFIVIFMKIHSALGLAQRFSVGMQQEYLTQIHQRYHENYDERTTNDKHTSKSSIAECV